VVCLVLLGIRGGVNAFNSPRGLLNGVVIVHFFIATVMLLAAAGDVCILRFGAPRGGAPGASSVAHVHPLGALHDRPDARAADPAAVRREPAKTDAPRRA
jgi:hypothetical protein